MLTHVTVQFSPCPPCNAFSRIFRLLFNENPKSSEPTILFWNNPWLGFPPRPYDLCGPDFTCNVVTSKAPDDLRKADAVIIHPVFTFLESQLGDAWKDMFSGYRSARQLYSVFETDKMAWFLMIFS